MYPAHQEVCYYGRLKGPLKNKKKGFGYFMINEIMTQMIDEHANTIKQSHDDLLKHLQQQNIEMFKGIHNRLKKVNARVLQLENAFKRAEGKKRLTGVRNGVVQDGTKRKPGRPAEGHN